VTDAVVDTVLGDLAPEDVRVRFPPSPTGNLHVGNVRSALFNWAFARHYGGTLVLRIEDTDLARSTEQAGQQLLDDLRWLGMHWDNGQLVYQSRRVDVYNRIIDDLIAALQRNTERLEPVSRQW